MLRLAVLMVLQTARETVHLPDTVTHLSHMPQGKLDRLRDSSSNLRSPVSCVPSFDVHQMPFMFNNFK